LRQELSDWVCNENTHCENLAGAATNRGWTTVRSLAWYGSFIPLVFCTTVSYVASAWGYRPFVSTDATVVDPKEVEVELGYFNLERVDEENTFITPKVVLNWGLIRNLEVVGEFEVEKAPDESARVVDPALFLKAVLKEGSLQGEDGMSVAVEAGPLLPATVAGERKFGFEGIGIISGRFVDFTYHVNVGGGMNRAKTDPFAVWGVIVEFPILRNVRLVGEINGEGGEGERADNSGLFGFIWQPASSELLVDLGLRRGISSAASDWQLTTGLTFAFSLPSP
jgi:hypothetical protein